LSVFAGLLAFAWLPYYPVWAILFIVISIGVIWALTAHGRDIKQV
jgi:cell division protein FtsX